MHRNVPQFALLALLGATLPIEILFPAPPCYGRQDQQPAQPASPAQQQQPPAATPPRPSSSSNPDSNPDSSQESSSKKELPPDDPAPEKAPAAAPKKSKPGVLPPEDDPAWDPFHAPSACAPISPSRAYCWQSATRRKVIRPRPYATTRNIFRCSQTRPTPRRSARKSTNSRRSDA
jgi:hypothetical protein